MAGQYGSSAVPRRRRPGRGGCLGAFLALLCCGALGYPLAVPVLIPALMAAQSPPQHVTPGQYAVLAGIAYAVALLLDRQASRRRRRVAPWVLPVRAAVLAGACSLLAHLVGAYAVPKLLGTQDPASANGYALQCLAVGAFAWGWRTSLRAWAGDLLERPPVRPARTGTGRSATRTTTVTRPSAGEVWVAMVPFRDRAEAARHYCVVVGTRSGYAEVLQITSKDKDHRDDYIRMENEGWDRTGKASWVEIGLAPRRVPYDSFLSDHPQGPCPPRIWREIQRRQAALGAARPPRPRPVGGTGPVGGSGPSGRGPRRPPTSARGPHA
ncbi:hypothetical protein ACIPYS_33625 [Kitasatospora sp. NPDC089913]|uniref:hypothetical protein n=1 Tax=Streptomycetaceae TaxID=2062 RepID=UPI00087A773A|nr:hypothetical protein [Streptomyces sp. TLI_053]SDT72333.1 hypothetical protein SAMN05216371_4280 [Streptomyces sp. TLI_053]